MALVLRIVVAHELLLALSQRHPVAVLHGGGIAGTGFLLLHLMGKALLIERQPVLAAYQLREVEREAIGVEELEG